MTGVFDEGVGVAGRGSTRVAGASDLLGFEQISKRFGGTQALFDVSFGLRRGEILALLGENGAGKSTLIKILAGVHTADSGAIRFHGRDVTGGTRRLPIAYIHQDIGLIEWMTVWENICLTLGYPRRAGTINTRVARERAARVLEVIGADIDPDIRIQSLSRTEKSLVAIARALAAEPEILVLDEPSASLPADEVARLFAALRRLRDRGVGMIYVSHRLDEVFEIADRMVVLRDGKVAGEREVEATTPEETILLIVGRQPSQVFRRPAERAGSPLLTLRSLVIDDVGPVDCEIHAGEIVGFVGLRGAGQEAVGRALFGVMPKTSGEVELNGRSIEVSKPAQAMAAGIELVSADRVGELIIPNLTIRENFFLNAVAAGKSLFTWTNPRREVAAALALGAKVGLRPNDPALHIELLSGGNQQKVVVGRWLNLEGKLYIFEDPTAGVDVGAKAEIYRLFDVALQAGSAIILISTDFEEISKVCHRAIVFDRGSVVAELAGADLTMANLLAAASANVTTQEMTAAGNASRGPDAIH